MKKLPILFVIFGVAGCSNQALYDNVRSHQRKECLKEPSATYSECIERTNKEYEEYERERQEALKKIIVDSDSIPSGSQA